MERRRRLADLVAVAASELLAHVLDHLPLARDHLKRLGDVLAKLGQSRAAAAEARASGPGTTTRSRGRCSGNGLRAGRLRVNARHCRGLGRGYLGSDLVGGSRGLQLFQLQFHLVQQPRGPLGVRAEPFAVQLGDLELQMSDQRLVIGPLGADLGKLGVRYGQRRLQRLDIFHSGGLLGVHKERWNHKIHRLRRPYLHLGIRFLASARRLWPPGRLRVTPVDPFQEIAHLPRGQRHHPVRGLRPDEPAPVQPLGVER